MTTDLRSVLPKYKCHKEVWGGRIVSIGFSVPSSTVCLELVLPIDVTLEPTATTAIESVYWFNKHKPEVGGYFVIHEDGYRSYSPAKAFEDGYTRILADKLTPEEEAKIKKLIGEGSVKEIQFNQISEAVKLVSDMETLVSAIEDRIGPTIIPIGVRTVSQLMKFCPATGKEKPYPSEAGQYRDYHRNTAWLFNPYTGKKRSPEDIGSDTFGHLIVTADSELKSA